MDNSVNSVDVMFGVGSDNDNTKVFLTGVLGKGPSGTPDFSARYEACTGLYSSAGNNVQYSDRKWHTIVFSSDSAGAVHAVVDGTHAHTGAGGVLSEFF